MFKRIQIDLSKVNNIFALLAVFLITAEGLLGFWFSQAKDSWERIIVGFFMTVILLCFLYLILKINKVNLIPKAFDETISPASQEVTKEEVEVVSTEQISGPEGSYIIDAPPSIWKTKVVSMNGLLNENLEIKDSNLLGRSVDSRENILLCSSNISLEIIPKPGKTIINGTILGTALIVKTPIQLSIVPLERLQPPFYTEFSFEHNVFKYLGQILQFGVFKMERQISGKINESRREFIQIELVQQLEHVDIMVNGKTLEDFPKVQINTNIIAIKGDIVDHLLIMTYPSSEDKIIAGLIENEISILKTIVNSFKPLKINDPIKLINDIKERGKRNYEDLMRNKGTIMFQAEFGIALKKLKEFNPNNSVDQEKIVRIIRPFRDFYKLYCEPEDFLDVIWEALDEAEKGNYGNLIEQVKEIIAELDTKEGDEGEKKLENNTQ